MQWWSGAHSRGEIRAKTSSIGGESPITKSFHWARCAKEERPDSPVYPRSNMGRKAAEVWFPRRIRRRKLFLRPLTGVRDEAQQHHIWRKGRQEDRGRRPLATHPYCSPCSSRTLCFHPRFRLGLPEKNKTPENFFLFFINFTNSIQKLLFLTVRWKTARKGSSFIPTKYFNNPHLNWGGFWAYLRRKKVLYSIQCQTEETALGEGFAPLRSLEAQEGERSAVLGDTSDSLRGWFK